MVVAFYIFLLIPIIIYLVFSVIEIWLTLQISARKYSKNLLFIQASTEVTHTLLVFAYAQFMVTFSPLLMQIGGRLWWPIALLMVAILLRGSLYLVLFYSEKSKQIVYSALLITYLAGVAALVWFLSILVPETVSRGFVPEMSTVPLVLILSIPALAIILIPLIAVYRHAFAQLKSR